ncbi:MAG: DUF4255 domain-containing protein [Alphaproteobacteria bacterium]|nr:DUF4255 domain-containing protein [Alphaproteobacteria bacterium]MCB9929441.1 DUF4255 domain-containing protein [Alphaproteobacteria bacterium]
MSDGYAIAAVTAVLRRTILEALSAAQVSDVTGTVPVTALPPDRVIPPAGAEPTQLNIFLHQVTRNAAFRNWDLPSRNAAGDLISGPPLAVDLHYLITAYGAEPFWSEMLLGHAALALHENATLTRPAIARALSPNPPDPLVPAVLRSAGIEAQIELIKLVPEAIDSEDMSRLWSAIQGQYRATMAYRASVVLIEPRAAGAAPPPVRSPGGRALPLANVTLESVAALTGARDPITRASTIVLSGQGFTPGEMTVELGETVATPAVGDVGSTTIQLDLSALTPRAGLLPLRALRTRSLGPAPTTPAVEVSNTLPLTLRPAITASNVVIDSTDTVDGQPVASGTVTLTLDPPVGRDQHAAMLLNTAGGGPMHRLPAPPNNGAATNVATVTQIAFAFRRLRRGPYLVRASVDGAESVLTVDGNGVYDGPEVTL